MLLPSSRPHPERVLTRAELRAEGYSRRRLDAALRRGELVRLRRDHYVSTGAVAGALQLQADRAVGFGGRLTCVSLLAALGVFIFGDDRLHLRVTAHAGRLRGRTSHQSDAVRVHWCDPRDAAPARDLVSLVDAVRDMLRCAQPRHAVATLDSMLNLGLVTRDTLIEVFAALPARYRAILALTDGRAEAGTETLVRLMVRQIGGEIELQVQITGVGRVDLLVDGWLIIECDSRAFHSSWDARRRDLRRDLAAAAQGYTTVRLLAEDILFHGGEVLELLRSVLTAPSRRRC